MHGVLRGDHEYEANPTRTDPSFKVFVDVVSEEWQWYRLFNYFGLHFPTKVIFGARYGLSRYIDESGFIKIASDSKSFSLDAAVTVDVADVMGRPPGVEASVGGAVAIEEADKQATKESVQTNSEEVTEFSVGKKMPKGGAKEWIKDLDSDPMPIRFALESICNHPEFDKKGEKEARLHKVCGHVLRHASQKGGSGSRMRSEGCSQEELVDDDGACALGKKDNKIITSSVNNLPDDLEHDVCALTPTESIRERRALHTQRDSRWHRRADDTGGSD